ncbi:MAG: NADH-ubiquinone oxidoreductase-F iron-sulfur binding region domain-containing protein, partial [Candidatus Korarchaeota archaeon]
AGAIMGSGGMVEIGEDNCMVDVARFFMTFTQAESCGKCTPCREGTWQMLQILTKITKGEGVKEDLQTLETLADVVRDTSLCALGQTAPNPILTTLRYFRDEYLSHIEKKKCPTKVCVELIDYTVVPEKCVGCHACAIVCPTGAAHGTPKQVHKIDNNICIRCGACYSACRYGAIIKVDRYKGGDDNGK